MNPPGNKLRMLVVSSDTYPPFRVDVAVLFGEELASRGHHIDWILQSENACGAVHTQNWGGGRVWVGPTDLGTSLFSRIRKHLLGIVHDLRLFGRMRTGDYDLIEVKDKFISGLFAMIAARIFRKRFVYWLSYPYPEEYRIRATDGTARYPFLYTIRGANFAFLLYKILLPAADHVFVQSEQMKRDIAAEGIPVEKMTAVPMGIRAGTGSVEATSVAAIPADEPSVLYLGTLTKVRRMDFLVRAFALVREAIPQARLYFVGKGDDPSDEQILINEVSRLGLQPSVVFVGQLPQAKALEYVKAARVCASPFFPSPILNSTSPTKVVEYMAMGRPVVANDHPEQRLVIEESGGGLCVPYEERAFANAIVELLEHPERGQAMGERGQRYVMEKRNYRVIADNVERELLKLMARG